MKRFDLRARLLLCAVLVGVTSLHRATTHAQELAAWRDSSFRGFGASALTFLATFGQAPAMRWIGTWKLNLQKSNIGVFAALGPTLKVVNQTLKFEETDGRLKLTADTTLSDGSSSHEEENLELDGKEVIFTDRRISFKRIDGNHFEIIVMVSSRIANGVGVNRFELSDDGKTLIETKVQTQRGIVPEGTDPGKGALIGTSTSVLVFDRVL